MQSDYKMLNESDTKEFRKKMGFPVTKDLKYYFRSNGCWVERGILNYEVIETYRSGSTSMLITLDDSTELRIHSDYLAEMQRPSFRENNSISGDKKKPVNLTEASVDKQKRGTRIDATPRNYVIIDLETSGFNHKKDDIIEIGAVRYSNGSEIDRYSALIWSGKQITEEIEKLTGITNSMLENNGISKREAIVGLENYLKAGEIIVGHNFATFDFYFLDDAYMDILCQPFSYDYVDTLFLSKKILKNRNCHNLEALSQEFDVDYSGAHRATEDCIINHFVYEALAFGDFNDIGKGEQFVSDCIDSYSEENLIDIDETNLIGWKKGVQLVLDNVIKKNELPENSIRLMENQGKNGDDAKSFSICIMEPSIIDDGRSSKRNDTIINIRENTLKSDASILRIEPRKNGATELIEFPKEAKVFRPQSGLYFQISDSAGSLISYIASSVQYAVDTYISKEDTFACCSRYMECSKQKKCVHRNRLFSTACQYRKNLETGKVFYGDDVNR